MKFGAEHADALAEIRANGLDVEFVRAVSVIDPLTGETTVDGSVITGAAMRVKGAPEVYEALSLIESSAPTLLFVPDEYGAAPELGAAVTWAGVTYTVRSVLPIEPDGTAILHRVVVAR